MYAKNKLAFLEGMASLPDLETDKCTKVEMLYSDGASVVTPFMPGSPVPEWAGGPRAPSGASDGSRPWQQQQGASGGFSNTNRGGGGGGSSSSTDSRQAPKHNNTTEPATDNDWGQTSQAFVMACWDGDSAKVEHLGRDCGLPGGRGGMRSFVDSFGNNGLMVAVQRQHEDLVLTLLSSPWDFSPDDTNRLGETALTVAARYGVPPGHGVAHALIAAGADVNAQDTFFGWSAAHWCCRRNDFNFLNCLIQSGRADMCLLDKGRDVDMPYTEVDRAKEIFDSRAIDITFPGEPRTPLQVAVDSGSVLARKTVQDELNRQVHPASLALHSAPSAEAIRGSRLKAPPAFVLQTCFGHPALSGAQYGADEVLLSMKPADLMDFENTDRHCSLKLGNVKVAFNPDTGVADFANTDLGVTFSHCGRYVLTGTVRLVDGTTFDVATDVITVVEPNVHSAKEYALSHATAWQLDQDARRDAPAYYSKAAPQRVVDVDENHYGGQPTMLRINQHHTSLIGGSANNAHSDGARIGGTKSRSFG